MPGSDFMSGPKDSHTAVFDADDVTGWLDPADVAARQARLEDTALVVRRLAHDFGNVLTGILGFSEMSLGLVSPASPAHQYTQEVRRCAQQGAELTQRLRWLSRRGTTEREAGSLAEMIDREERRLRAESGAAVKLRFRMSGPLPPVALDGEPLRHILQQVLDNARDAVASGGTVTLSARGIQLTDAECRRLLGAARPGPHIEVTVSDDGCGLSAEVRERLFVEPFFSGKPRHRGMGLAIVYGILRSCGGGFRLDSAPGGGTIVRLILPIATASRYPTPVVNNAQTEGERFLIVEDDTAPDRRPLGAPAAAGHETIPVPAS
jgi:signal transduction histidine kinase